MILQGAGQVRPSMPARMVCTLYYTFASCTVHLHIDSSLWSHLWSLFLCFLILPQGHGSVAIVSFFTGCSVPWWTREKEGFVYDCMSCMWFCVFVRKKAKQNTALWLRRMFCCWRLWHLYWNLCCEYAPNSQSQLMCAGWPGPGLRLLSSPQCNNLFVL